MTGPLFTEEQRRAIHEVDVHLVVSAGAGSGKTAVLAERCAYLVCDAPPPHGCDVDDLLVVTFTDAAAAEMRGRIVDAIRRRSHHRRADDRLAEQAARAEGARICTLHSYCRRLLKQWFQEAGIDPHASLLDAPAAAVLRREVLAAMFEHLYAAAQGCDDAARAEKIGSGAAESADDLHGEAPIKTEMNDAARDQWVQAVLDSSLENRRGSHAPTVGPGSDLPSVVGRHAGRFAEAFVRLVDVYGLGEDESVAQFVLQCFEYASSLPDPQAWLARCGGLVSDQSSELLAWRAGSLLRELGDQQDHCEAVAAALWAAGGACEFHAQIIADYGKTAGEWKAVLVDAGIREEGMEALRAHQVSAFDLVCGQVRSWSLSSKGAPRKKKDMALADEAVLDFARECFEQVKERLFEKRLRDRHCRFFWDELREGLSCAAPHTAVLVELVGMLDAAYTDRKRRLNVLDFSDLERLALRLLETPHGQATPTALHIQKETRYVLVDECQDINPIQQAILDRIGTPQGSAEFPRMFMVGDPRQSIYRFRMAEPQEFRRRVQSAANSPSHRSIPLSVNFRSERGILLAINQLFDRASQVMDLSEFSQSAALQPGRASNALESPADTGVGVEVHVVQRDVAPLPNDSWDHPSRWAPIEREAFVIGRRIQDLMQERDAQSFNDVVVLLRAASGNADRISRVLARMNIPSSPQVGGALTDAPEIRQVLAALRVLDNAQQDVPLAAILRSGFFGMEFSDDDLTLIRCIDRSVPFHAALVKYGEGGFDAGLRDRVCGLFATLRRFRKRCRGAPISRFLWELCDETGFLAKLGGMSDGLRRRANLERLHDLAQSFGTGRRQGLRRFLEFLDAAAETEETIGAAGPTAPGENAVRIMSIHRSKGLEFPIVFVAGLGSLFNLSDRHGSMIQERSVGIGLRVVDEVRGVEYPSAAYAACVDEIERQIRAEELRTLYVAMTRAQNRLIMIGSTDAGRCLPHGLRHPLTRIAFTSARFHLDWMIPTLADLAAEGKAIQPPGAEPRADGRFPHVLRHQDEEIRAWRMASLAAEADESRIAASMLSNLPDQELRGADEAQIAAILRRIEAHYPYMAAATLRSAVGATEFKRLFGDGAPIEEGGAGPAVGEDSIEFPVSRNIAGGAELAQKSGVLMHRLLQHLNFSGLTGDSESLELQITELTARGVFRREESEGIDRGNVAWFLQTSLWRRLHQAGTRYHREFSYISAAPTEHVDSEARGDVGDFVLVRGIIDGILQEDDALEIIDYKTDRVHGESVEPRARDYRPQMELYSQAASNAFRLPVLRCHLVFLTARRIVEWVPVGIA